MKLLRTVLFSFITLICNYGKTQTMQMADIQVCTGDTAGIAIVMSAMDSLGAVTLKIRYDTAKLKFDDLANINPLASGIMFNDMLNGGRRIGKIGISWVTGGSGVNFSAGTFAELKFVVLAGNCPVTFQVSECEIVNYDVEIINVAYTNGSVSNPAIPAILAQPSPLALYEYQNGYFAVNASNTDSIKWQVNQGAGWADIVNNSTFNGSDNDTLFVSHPGGAFNGAYFRCLLRNLCHSVRSDSVMLTINGLFSGENSLLKYSIYPNPFDDNILIKFPQTAFIEEIVIFATDGRIVKKISENKQTSHLSIESLCGLEKGTYFFEIVSKNKEGLNLKNIFKMVKN